MKFDFLILLNNSYVKGHPLTYLNIYEFKDGKIIREHGLPDMFSLLMQLGVIPVPEQ